MATKTAQEIQALKDSWKSDPHWDIEDTEGFEDHREDLIAYRQRTEKTWADHRNVLILGRMDEFRSAAPSYDMGLVSAIIDLERQMRTVTEELAGLKREQNLT